MNQKIRKYLHLFIVLALIIAPLRSVMASSIDTDMSANTGMVHMQHEMPMSDEMMTNASSHDCNQCCEGDCCEQNCSACVYTAAAILNADTVKISFLKDKVTIPVISRFSEHAMSPVLRPPIS